MYLKEPNFQILDQDFQSYWKLSYGIQLSCRTVLNWLMILSFISHKLQLRSKNLLYEFNHYKQIYKVTFPIRVTFFFLTDIQSDIPNQIYRSTINRYTLMICFVNRQTQK